VTSPNRNGDAQQLFFAQLAHLTHMTAVLGTGCNWHDAHPPASLDEAAGRKPEIAAKQQQILAMTINRGNR
jgi:hypothetical protein